MKHSVGIPEIVDDNELDANIEDDGEDDVQCTGFKNVNGVAEDGTNDPMVLLKMLLMILMMLLKMLLMILVLLLKM